MDQSRNHPQIRLFLVGSPPLRTSIDPTLCSTVSHLPDAYQLWESHKVRFSIKNSVRKHLLLDDITNCKQNGQTVLEFYGRLTKLWDEYNGITSSCSCTCAAATTLARDREDTRVHRFLFGLDEVRFSTIRSQIIHEDPHPPLNSIYSRIIREEQHDLTMRSKELNNTAVGFSVCPDLSLSASGAAVARSRDPNRFCSHCNRKGHDNFECFLLHGYPDWWYEKEQNSDSHLRANSPSGRGRGGRGPSQGRGRANATRSTPTEHSTSPQPTADQLAALINLLQTQKSQISTERLSGPFYEDTDWSR